MRIELSGVAKKYQSDYIIQNFDYQFSSEEIVGISGKNGSGKSTFIQLISSVLTPTAGKISYFLNDEEIPLEKAKYKIALCSPAMALIDHNTVAETIDFHFSFKEYLPTWNKEKLLQEAWLSSSQNKLVAELSSGMKQRLQLALAFFSNVNCLLLDEPTSNLDEKGINWFNRLIEKYKHNRLLIIASNEDRDFTHCQTIITEQQFK